MRIDGRQLNELRPLSLTPDYIKYAEGSVLITLGNTRILCNATVEDGVPRWMQQQGISGGWITGEYAMLPRATSIRTPRETNGLSGRTQEIRRLIGRSLRAAVDLKKLGPRTIILDCDVLEADGGTRTAAISGAYVALALALRRLITKGAISPETLQCPLAATSVGLVDGEALLDLNYMEDCRAQVDANIVMNAQSELIEVQVSAEGHPFQRRMLDQLLDLAAGGIARILAAQHTILAEKP